MVVDLFKERYELVHVLFFEGKFVGLDEIGKIVNFLRKTRLLDQLVHSLLILIRKKIKKDSSKFSLFDVFPKFLPLQSTPDKCLELSTFIVILLI